MKILHTMLRVADVGGTYERIHSLGGTTMRDPGPVAGGTTVIAFVQDPDGYTIELIQRAN